LTKCVNSEHSWFEFGDEGVMQEDAFAGPIFGDAASKASEKRHWLPDG
jgi:hypothetical protein